MNVKETLRSHLSSIVLPYGDHPGKSPEEAAYFYIGEPEEVVPGIYFFTSLANVAVIDCGDCLMQIDTGMHFKTPTILENLRKKTDKRIDTIVYTHFHLDHCSGGIHYFRDNENRGHPRPRIIAHRNFRDNIDTVKLLSGFRTGVNRTQFQVKFDLGDVIYPDTEFTDHLEITVGHETFSIRHGGGHTDDSIWVYCPDREVLCCGDLFQWTAPNVGNPLKEQRYAKENAQALEQMASLKPKVLLPGHGPKILGENNVQEALLTSARYLNVIQDHVVKGLNGGLSQEKIIESLSMPDDLMNSKYLPPVYGRPEFIARGILRRYAGYYSGNPSELFPPSILERSKEILQLADGSDKLLARAREQQIKGNMELACQLAEWVIHGEPENRLGWELYGTLFKERAEKEKNIQTRGIFNSAVRKSVEALDHLEKTKG